MPLYRQACAINYALIDNPQRAGTLTRYHGVFAPHSKYRALVTPAKRGKGKKGIEAQQQPDQTAAERQASMTWPLPHIHVLRGTGTS